MKPMLKKHWLVILLLIVFGLIYSYRLLEVPTGLTIDEAAFGYNAVLLSQTAHDENDRFMPVFVLSIDGRDWRQPVTQYYLTFLFWLFGPSVWLLRFSSVLVILGSALLLYWLLNLVLNQRAALVGSVLFLTTPVILMHARMGLDNIMPLPWTLLWLICLVKAKGGSRWWGIAGLALGVNFYSYKAMRAVVPVWTAITLLLIWFRGKNRFRNLAWFSLGLAPFILIIPLLERLYAGAVFDKHGFSFSNIYDFLYPYLSSFDLSFLFIKGDSTWYHSTQKHGMFLLSLLPLWLTGIYYSLRRRSWLTFWLLAFALAPILFGMVNSVYRASRLIYLVPMAVAAAAYGWQNLEKLKWGRAILLAWSLLALVNFFDFTNYYFTDYPVDAKTNQAFGELEQFHSYRALSEAAETHAAAPYITRAVALADGESGTFFESIYFGGLVEKWDQDDALPEAPAVLLSVRETIPGAQRLEVALPYYYLHLVE
jgi:4-amino-4-deoxy-L-arabinose transferase-like glycosyltransferase